MTTSNSKISRILRNPTFLHISILILTAVIIVLSTIIYTKPTAKEEAWKSWLHSYSSQLTSTDKAFQELSSKDYTLEEARPRIQAIVDEWNKLCSLEYSAKAQGFDIGIDSEKHRSAITDQYVYLNFLPTNLPLPWDSRAKGMLAGLWDTIKGEKNIVKSLASKDNPNEFTGTDIEFKKAFANFKFPSGGVTILK